MGALTRHLKIENDHQMEKGPFLSFWATTSLSIRTSNNKTQVESVQLGKTLDLNLFLG